METTNVAEKAMARYPVAVYYLDHRNGGTITPAWVDVPLSEEDMTWSMSKDLGFLPAFSFPEDAVVRLVVWEQRHTAANLPLRTESAEAACAGSTQDFEWAAQLHWTTAVSGPILIRDLDGLLQFLTKMAPLLEVLIATERSASMTRSEKFNSDNEGCRLKHFASWLNAHTIEEPGARVSRREVYDAYCHTRDGESLPAIDPAAVGRNFKRLRPHIEIRYLASGGRPAPLNPAAFVEPGATERAWVYLGIRLLSEEELALARREAV